MKAVPINPHLADADPEYARLTAALDARKAEQQTVPHRQWMETIRLMHEIERLGRERAARFEVVKKSIDKAEAGRMCGSVD